MENLVQFMIKIEQCSKAWHGIWNAPGVFDASYTAQDSICK